MKKIEIEITDFTADGDGIGRVEDGKTVFVPGALIGDVVAAEVVTEKKHYISARLLSVISGANRVTPLCGVENCGGCPLKHFDYAAQMEWKRKNAENTLKRLGGADVRVEPFKAENAWGYRNKAQFPFGRVDGAAVLGFFSRNSHNVVAVKQCPAVLPSHAAVVAAINDWAQCFNMSVYDEKTGRGLLRNVLIRISRKNDILLCLIINSDKIPHRKELSSALRQAGVTSFCLNENQSRTNTILGKKFTSVFGEPYIEDELCGLKFRVSPQSFFQVNAEMAGRVYETALDFAAPTKNDTIIDAFCGIGTISLFMAKHAKNVIGVESVPQAVCDAVFNAKLNNVSNAAFIEGAAENVLRRVLRETANAVLIADPPRKGCERAFLDAIAQSGVLKFVYISCNPATLARDVKILAEAGFSVEKARVFDMFPQTAHVETVCLITRKDGKHQC